MTKIVLIFILVAKTPSGIHITDLWLYGKYFESEKDCQDAAETKTTFNPEIMYVCKDSSKIYRIGGLY